MQQQHPVAPGDAPVLSRRHCRIITLRVAHRLVGGRRLGSRRIGHRLGQHSLHKGTQIVCKVLIIVVARSASGSLLEQCRVGKAVVDHQLRQLILFGLFGSPSCVAAAVGPRQVTSHLGHLVGVLSEGLEVVQRLADCLLLLLHPALLPPQHTAESADVRLQLVSMDLPHSLLQGSRHMAVQSIQLRLCGAERYRWGVCWCAGL
mmetsp:Transcript_14436/g.41561  ORF Transcript_14436/g.41561 Transcript_14436/m.41561 type:complete len:204 (-) Transcript_14436:258-869(-)